MSIRKRFPHHRQLTFLHFVWKAQPTVPQPPKSQSAVWLAAGVLERIIRQPLDASFPQSLLHTLVLSHEYLRMRRSDCPRPAGACLLVTVALLATGLAPPSYDERCLQGRRHLEQKQFDGAIEAYTQAIDLSPDQSLGYLGRALAYQGKSDFDRAIIDCSEAMRLAPKEAAPCIVRAECHEANGDLDRALADFTAAIEQNPTRAQSYLARARIQHKK